MKLLLHFGTLRGAGSGKVGRNVLRELSARAPQHFFTALIPKQWGWAQEMVESNCRLISIPAGIPTKVWTENIRIRRELQSGYDAVFSMTDTSTPFAGAPHLLMVQQPYLAYGPDERDFPISRRFKVRQSLIEAYFRLGLASLDHLTVQTKVMKARLCERWGIDRSNVTVIPSAVDIEPVSEPRSPKSSEDPYICYVATNSPHKNFEVLPPMMARLRKAGSQVVCKLTVTPDQVPEMASQAKKLGVMDCFDFMGRIDTVPELLHGAVALVMPSKLETFGLPYYEALAAGCPVIAADRDFAREACGEAAVYADANKPREFAQAVLDMMGATSSSQELSEQGRQRFAQRQLSWPEVAQRYLELIDRLARTNTAARRSG